MTNGGGVVKQRRDFMPFGEEFLANATFGNRHQVTDGGVTTYNPVSGPTQQFTSKERDAETGLDYFGARYVSGAQGRFHRGLGSFYLQVVSPTSIGFVPQNHISYGRPPGGCGRQ